MPLGNFHFLDNILDFVLVYWQTSGYICVTLEK